MIITRIKLENWKNFAKVDIPCGKRIFLIGPNASGKSNFLDALRFLRDVAQNGLEQAVLDQRGGIKSIRYINARQYPDITISVILDDIWEYSLIFGTKKGKSTPLVIKEIVKQNVDGKWKTILNRPEKLDNEDPARLTQTALQQVNANKEFREIPEFFSTIEYRHILPQLVREPKAFSPAPVVNDPFGRDLVFTIWKTPEKTRISRLRKINEALKIAVQNLEDLTVVQDSDGLPHLVVKYMHWRSQGAYQREDVFSDGTLRLLALLWSLLSTDGPLLLEEPELSLHEEIVAQLPTIFARLDRNRKKTTRQIFVTTHARSLLDDPGIGPNEVLRLEPGHEGVEILLPTDQEHEMMRDGMTAADILLPKTRPENIHQLRLF
ncbi:MAG: AAA family ATPase [Deltaproteobacteria bacterium]|jgi:predicted ATPase|nr:AAA family ATPase [Deltaproteobacteria bacterium]